MLDAKLLRPFQGYDIIKLRPINAASDQWAVVGAYIYLYGVFACRFTIVDIGGINSIYVLWVFNSSWSLSGCGCGLVWALSYEQEVLQTSMPIL